MGLVVVTAALVVAPITSACSGASDDEGAGTTAPAETGGEVVPGETRLGIADLAFEPSTLPVAAGETTITITNSDSADHTFTLDDGSVDVSIAAGETATATVDVSETVGFHCEIHPSMTGTLEVT